MNNSVIPKVWKPAYVLPLHKVGDLGDYNFYVTLLSRNFRITDKCTA